MPRKPRFYIPDVPVHIVQRGHSREPVFFENDDYQAYLGWLAEAAERYDCAIHSYVLMSNHIHILATPANQRGLTPLTLKKQAQLELIATEAGIKEAEGLYEKNCKDCDE